MKQKEIWKPIKGYEGYFEISNLGRVKSIERYVRQCGHMRFVPEKIKKIHNNSAGYPCVTLCKDGKSKMCLLHLLLAEAFLPNPEKKTQVDHINTNILDYRLENLRWVTPKENCNNPLTLQHCRNNTYTKETSDKANATKARRKTKTAPHKVFQYTKDGRFVNEFSSYRDAQRHTGISCSQIRFVLDDNTQSAGGFLWMSNKIDSVKYVARIHPSSKPVLYYDKDGNFIKEFQSIKVASKETGIHASNIYYSIRSKYNPTKYIFRFKNNPL